MTPRVKAPWPWLDFHMWESLGYAMTSSKSLYISVSMDQNLIRHALAILEHHTCVTFREVNSPQEYNILFTNEDE